MCDFSAQLTSPDSDSQPSGTDRRRFLAGAAGAATMTLLASNSAAATPSPRPTPTGRSLGAGSKARTRVVLLGTAGGPTWWDGLNREGIATAVVVGDAVYLVDCGEGVGRQLYRAGLSLAKLQSIYLTHMHSDHTIDYINLLLYGWYQNLEQAPRPVEVFGPGNRGMLPPVWNNQKAPRLENPGNPTPGTVEFTDYLMKAFAYDINDRMRDNLKTDLRTIIKPVDIRIPDRIKYHPNTNVAPTMQPIRIHEDDRVRVSAILAYHPPTSPAFAYRFDTDDGSVVISGDTGYHDNIVRLAHKCDVLVHEVVDDIFMKAQYGPNPTPAQAALTNHLITSHTSPSDTGRVAQRAGVKTLVLSHYVPGNIPADRLARAKDHFSGNVVFGDDLDVIGVSKTARSR